MKSAIARIILGAPIGAAAVLPIVLLIVEAWHLDSPVAFLLGPAFGGIGANVGIVVANRRAFS